MKAKVRNKDRGGNSGRVLVSLLYVLRPLSDGVPDRAREILLLGGWSPDNNKRPSWPSH